MNASASASASAHLAAQMNDDMQHCRLTTTDPIRTRRKSHGYATQLGNVSIVSRAIYIITFIMVLSSKATVTMAQEVQVCSCSPPIYRWKLNFSKGCPLEISPVAGTKSPFCVYDDLSPGFVGDLVPTLITDLVLVDLDLEITGVKTLRVNNATLRDGDVITFESVTALEPNQFTGGLQGQMRAENAQGSAFTLSFLIRFSNLCDILPFNVGDSLGFLEFVSSFCFMNVIHFCVPVF